MAEDSSLDVTREKLRGLSSELLFKAYANRAEEFHQRFLPVLEQVVMERITALGDDELSEVYVFRSAGATAELMEALQREAQSRLEGRHLAMLDRARELIDEHDRTDGDALWERQQELFSRLHAGKLDESSSAALRYLAASELGRHKYSLDLLDELHFKKNCRVTEIAFAETGSFSFPWDEGFPLTWITISYAGERDGDERKMSSSHQSHEDVPEVFSVVWRYSREERTAARQEALKKAVEMLSKLNHPTRYFRFAAWTSVVLSLVVLAVTTGSIGWNLSETPAGAAAPTVIELLVFIFLLRRLWFLGARVCAFLYFKYRYEEPTDTLADRIRAAVENNDGDTLLQIAAMKRPPEEDKDGDEELEREYWEVEDGAGESMVTQEERDSMKRYTHLLNRGMIEVLKKLAA